MAVASLTRTDERVLNALDPRLSFLASQAAVELDNLRLGKATKLVAVQLLRRRLDNSTELVEGTNDRKMLLDAPTVSVLSNAISASRSQEVRTLAELASEAWQMASDLQKAEEVPADLDKSTIERLRSFCLFLSQNARSYRQAIYETQPEFSFGS